MNKYSEKILKYLIKHSSKDSPLTNQDLYNSIPYDNKTIDSSIKQLITEDKIINNTRPFIASNQIRFASISYYPTTIGKNYFKDKYFSILIKGIKEFIRSIFCPILVSFITTLITIFLSR